MFNGLQDQTFEYLAPPGGAAGGEVGIANFGLFRRGIKLEGGQVYEGVVRLRTDRARDVYVSLRDAQGGVLAESKLRVGEGRDQAVRGFEKHSFSLTPKESGMGSFAIVLKAREH